MKRCPKCGETKPLTDFYGKRRPSGWCKPCDRERSKATYTADPAKAHAAHRRWVERNPDRVRMHKARSAYGITEEQFDALARVCVICGSRSELRIDHNHRSGRVRGMLCDGCNKGLGFFADDPSLLFRAAEYVLGLASPDIFAATYEPAEES